MPQAFLFEFRRDEIARKGVAPLDRIAKDFGVSESCLQRWLKLADIEDRNRPAVTQADAAELREVKKNEILRRAAAVFPPEDLVGVREETPAEP